MEGILTVVVLGAPILIGALAFVGLYPPAPKDLGGAPDLDPAAEPVSIPLPDGDRLRGWHVPGAGFRSVLLLHGYGRTHHRMWRYGGFLRRAGHGLLTFDFRSSRRHRRVPTTLGVHELVDARAALRWLLERGETEVAVLGESLGGTVALLLAAESPEVTAVVVDCPFATGREAVEDTLGRFLRLPHWPAVPVARRVVQAFTGHDPYKVDAVGAASELTDRPILFIHSEQDKRLSTGHTMRLWRAAGAKDPVWWVAGAGHNQGWLRRPEEYERRVLEFLADAPGRAEPRAAHVSEID